MVSTSKLDPRQAILELRGQIAKYHLGLPGAAALRDRLVRVESLADVEAILLPIIEADEIASVYPSVA
jgi:hypothetical protein